jgi:hypothetical protein
MLTNAGSPAIIYYIGLMRHKRKLSSAEVEGAGDKAPKVQYGHTVTYTDTSQTRTPYVP